MKLVLPAASGPDPLLRFEAAGKVFAGRRGQPPVAALSGIDLDVPRGSVTGVIGPSGAGKSTLIRLANGLETATSGRLFIDGEDVTRLDEAGWRRLRRSIGMIFQHFNLLSSRTVAENVAFPLELQHVPQAELKRKVAGLLDLVGLSDKADRYPAELSGGQKQRVGIARALATDPKLLLCDEATSALDPETTRSILALLRRVNLDLGVTILLITHEIPVIKEICGRVAILEAGRVVEAGGSFDILTNPSHPATARLVAAVSGVELPESIAARLRTDPVPAGGLILRIGFAGQNAAASVIAKLGALAKGDIEILAARIDDVAGRPFGGLIVRLPAERLNAGQTAAALATEPVTLEVIGHAP